VVDPSGRYFVWYARTPSIPRVNLLTELPYHVLMPPYTQEDMATVDYFTHNVDVPLNFEPEVPVPDPAPGASPSESTTTSDTIEPWAWAVGAALLAVVLAAWIVFAIMFIRFKFRIAQRQR
jgi:hypothetical protein